MNCLIRKLENFISLSVDDKRVIDTMLQERVQSIRPREDLIREGDKPEHVCVMLAGWACRYKMLEDGRRQIVGLFLPGDTCDDNVFLLREMDHSIGAVTAVTYASIGRDMFERLARDRPWIIQGFHWETLVNIAIQREWTVNLGSRSAAERLAHLFCELYFRLRSVGMTSEDSCDMPLTQTDLGELAGLSTVHVNRMVQELRAARLISLQKGVLTIPDLESLQNAAFFNPTYLHLDREGWPASTSHARSAGGAP